MALQIGTSSFPGRNRNWPTLIFLIAFALAVPAIVIFRTVDNFRDAELRADLARNGVRTVGTVRYLVSGPRNQEIIFDFRTKDGRKIEGVFNNRHEIDPGEAAFLKSGSSIPIIYDLADPDRAMPARLGFIPQSDMSNAWWKAIALIFFVILWPLAGCWLILRDSTQVTPD